MLFTSAVLQTILPIWEGICRPPRMDSWPICATHPGYPHQVSQIWEGKSLSKKLKCLFLQCDFHFISQLLAEDSMVESCLILLPCQPCTQLSRTHWQSNQESKNLPSCIPWWKQTLSMQFSRKVTWVSKEVPSGEVVLFFFFIDIASSKAVTGKAALFLTRGPFLEQQHQKCPCPCVLIIFSRILLLNAIKQVKLQAWKQAARQTHCHSVLLQNCKVLQLQWGKLTQTRKHLGDRKQNSSSNYFFLLYPHLLGTRFKEVWGDNRRQVCSVLSWQEQKNAIPFSKYSNSILAHYISKAVWHRSFKHV